HKSFRLAVRPANGNIGRSRFTESEVDPKIVLGDERPAAPDFINLFASASGHGNARANRIAPGSKGAHDQGASVARAKILQQRRRFTHVDEHDLEFSIVVQITDGEAARRMGCSNARAALRGEIKELAVATVPVEKSGLFELLPRAGVVYLGIHVP